MAMSYHMEARIKQDRLNRWHELKRQAEMEPSQGMGNKLEFSSNKQKKESVLVTDPGQFHQIRSVHAWTGTEHNRRSYDYSCEGPLLGSSWRDLRRELNFREKSLPTAMFEGRGRVVPRHEFVPADPAFMSK